MDDGKLDKVIKAFEWCRGDKPSCDGCPYDIKNAKCLFLLHSDALELLEEQQQIVRCKDCKHRPLCEEKIGGKVADENWFCADGELKE